MVKDVRKSYFFFPSYFVLVVCEFCLCISEAPLHFIFALLTITNHCNGFRSDYPLAACVFIIIGDMIHYT
jgi:hypothetical protein